MSHSRNPSDGASISHTNPWSQLFPEHIYKYNGSLRRLRALKEERANENREMTVALTYDKQ